MDKNLRYFIFYSSFVFLFFVCEFFYLSLQNKNIEIKNSFVRVVSLPDLAISTETKYIRHRSLGDIGSVFSEDPESISYFTSTFVYAPSNVLNITPNKVTNDFK